jgi:hypothetical protein
MPGFLKFMEYPVSLVMKLLIELFDHCWIPDYPGEQNLTGNLSHRFPLLPNAVFIGPLSRFSPSLSRTGQSFRPDHQPGLKSQEVELLILLSGPEPQRSRLEGIIAKQIAGLRFKTIVLQGLPGKTEVVETGPHHTFVTHLPTETLKQLVRDAKYIICRSGYTSIMDLAALKKKAMLIPTPGQTEQEYLATYLSGKGMFLTCPQDKLDLSTAITELERFRPEFSLPGEDYLIKHLDNL